MITNAITTRAIFARRNRSSSAAAGTSACSSTLVASSYTECDQ
jgi:hypothetical protein